MSLSTFHSGQHISMRGLLCHLLPASECAMEALARSVADESLEAVRKRIEDGPVLANRSSAHGYIRARARKPVAHSAALAVARHPTLGDKQVLPITGLAIGHVTRLLAREWMLTSRQPRTERAAA